jgi:hypothetical protein
MEANNLSRKNFKKFCSDNNYKRVGNRNVFQLDELKIIYASNQGNEIRQYYEDCDGAFLNGKFYSKSDFVLGGVTRITPKGLKAFNAKLSKGE